MTQGTQARIYPVNKLQAVVAAMEAQGIKAAEALRGTGVPPPALNSPETKISVAQLLTAYRNALRLCRDPAFALRLGRSTQVTTYGIYGYALLSAPSQRALIDMVAKYHRLLLATADLSFREQANTGTWTIEPLAMVASEPDLCRFIVELYVGSITTLSDDIIERPGIRKELRLSWSWSADLPDYEAMVHCPVRFGQDRNELIVDTTWIDQPIRSYNELTFAAVQKTCAELLEQMGSTPGIAHEVRIALLESAGRCPSFQQICRRLATSPRTMRRKLQAEGTSYGALVNETRTRLAKKYLRETVLTVDEIAIRIGYSDASNFRRGFQRATEVTPAAYRRGAS